VAGCRRGDVLVSVCAGVGVVCESIMAAQRALGPGRAGGVRGTGETGLWGVSRVPRCLHLPPAEESGAVCVHCRAERGAWALSSVTGAGFACAFPGHSCGGPPRVICSFLGHSCGGFCLECGFGLVPLVSGTRGVELGVPDLGHIPSRVGVRSGKRRRHGASTSVQAAGGIEPKPRRAAPAPAGAALSGRCWCAATVRPEYGGSGHSDGRDQSYLHVSLCRNFYLLEEVRERCGRREFDVHLAWARATISICDNVHDA
jgi:hypothetical protein